MLSPSTNRRLSTLLTLLILSALLYLVGIAGTFLAQFLGIALLFFLAWLLAYLLRPAQQRLRRLGLPSALAALVTYLAGPLLVLAAGALLLPPFTGQVGQLQAHLDSYANRLAGLLGSVEGLLTALGVSPADLQTLEARVREQATTTGAGLLQGLLATLPGLGQGLFGLTMILVFSLSFLTDGEALGTKILAALPARWREAAHLIGTSVTTSFGSFVRGQLLSALVYGLLNAAVMLAFGLPYVLVAAPAAGLLIMVPLVGNYLAYLPPLLVTLGERPDAALPMLIVLAIVQGLYLNVIAPRIMAQAVGMHPLLTTAAILVFGQVGGFWGAFFGIPLAATLGQLAPPALRLVHSVLAGEDAAGPIAAQDPRPQMVTAADGLISARR